MSVYPKKTGALCARMNRGFNGQDANGLTIVITLPDRLSACSYKGGGGKYLNGTAV